MDFYGQVLDELSELWERLDASPHGRDGRRLQKILERAMKEASRVERERTARRQPANQSAGDELYGPPPPGRAAA